MTATPPPSDTFDVDGLPLEIGAAEREKRLQQRVLHHPEVRILAFARFFTSLGLAAMAYGVMVYLATIGTSQVIISLVGRSVFFPRSSLGLAAASWQKPSPTGRPW